MNLINRGAKAWMITRKDPFYVDKTGMLEYLNDQIEKPYRYIAVTRIRRFGKTTDMNMTGAYYDRTVDGAAAFAGLQIANSKKFDQYRNKYNVISINMVRMLGGEGPLEGIYGLTTELVAELAEKFPDVHFKTEIEYDAFLASATKHMEERARKQSTQGIPPASCSKLLMNALEAVYENTGVQFVFLVDEWDVFFRRFPDQSAQNIFYLGFLQDIFKDQDYIALAYMTGILPIKKYGQHSALNMFREFTMVKPSDMAPYMGFTTEQVKELCARVHSPLSFKKLRSWYDGYILQVPPESLTNPSRRPKQVHIYSPYSVTNALLARELGNYWTESDTLTILREAVRFPFGGLKYIVGDLMKGARQKIQTRSYQNDMVSFESVDDVLTMLVHVGYLAYDARTQEVFIPNEELKCEFQSMVKQEPGYGPVLEIIDNSKTMMEAIWAEDAETVAACVQKIMDTVDEKSYYNEQVLAMAIRTGLLYGENYYTFFPEVATGRGRADTIGIPLPTHPELPALLFETKIDKSAESALDQLHQKKYPERLKKYGSNILFLGVNYDKTLKSTAPNYKIWTDVIIEHGL